MKAAVVAVDFGATSIRVCRVELGAGAPRLEVVHRYHHRPVGGMDGVLRWDWSRLVEEMEQGLRTAITRGSVASIGVDTWGVDYGLLDADGQLVAPPVSYRDARTAGHQQIVERIGAEQLYATTGLQIQPFNTIFQLAAHDRAEINSASHVLLLPELLVHHLTGAITAERTSAGCTGLLDISTEKWSSDLVGEAAVEIGMLPDISAAGTRAGVWCSIPVHLVGGHDTASAVAAMGPGPEHGTAFVSAGTWLLVGREQESPDLSDAARAANFTNELGVEGGVRFLRNLAGAWLLEGCRSAWGNPPVAELLSAANEQPSGPVVDTADPAFLQPDDMVAAVTGAAHLPRSASPAKVTRCIVDSMAAGTAEVLDQLGGVASVQVFGGASTWTPYRDRLADITGLPVRLGPTEATALGNALVQGIALGIYRDLHDARSNLEIAV